MLVDRNGKVLVSEIFITSFLLMAQGNWVGFRSCVAEDKFLQVKRKGLHRLAFHNAQFGTWEQWEIVQGQAHLPWEKLSLGFRNRRLPQVGIYAQSLAYL